MMKKVYFFYALIPLFSACDNSSQQKLGSRQDTIPVSVQSIEKADSNHAIESSGLFTTDDETVLSFKTGGTIEQLHVKEGDRIKKGQLLAQINPIELLAGYEQAKLSNEKARRDYERVSSLYRDSVATLEQMQNAETAYHVSQQQLKSAQYNRDQTRIIASNDGFVLSRFANVGQVVGPGSPIMQVNSAGNNGWLLKVGLSDRQWAQVNVGDSAEVYAEVLKKAMPATIHRKSEAIDPNSGTFTVTLKLNATGTMPIASGMFGKASIYTNSDHQSWSIPYSAVLDASDNKAFVFITNDNKVARRIPIVVGELQSNQVIVIEGLEDVRSLIVSGSAYLTDGSPIRIK